MKHSTIPRVMVLCLSVLTVREATAQKTGRDRVLKVDAVALIDHGQEIEGKVDYQQRQGRYNYLFANADNLKQFQGDPARYEIQLGGACGRMGALSGEGSPKLFAVHDGRLYIFASEQCKRSFLAGPEKVLLRDERQPVTTEASLGRGRELLERAVNAVGGAAQLDSLKTYREQLSRKTQSGGKDYTVTDALTLLPPHAARTDHCWNEQCWATVVCGSEGWSTDQSGSEPLVPAQHVEFWRGPGCHPLMLLCRRNLPAYMVAADGSRRTVNVPGEGELQVDLLSVFENSATKTLGVDAGGRIVLMTHQGRGPSLSIGRIEQTFSSFQKIGGLMLPTHVDVTFDGKPDEARSGTFVVQRVNHPSDAALFSRPTEPQ